MRTSISFLALVVAVSACGDKNKNLDNPTPGLGISLDPSTVNVSLGTDATTTLNITRQGPVLGSTVTVTTSTPPQGVTVTVNPANESISTTLTVNVDASAAEAASVVTVTATAGTYSASATLTVVVGTPSALTITGKVASQLLLPLGSSSMAVWSHGSSVPAIASTDAQGAFSFAGVAPPYDVLVTTPSGNTLFVGLTRADPTLIIALEDRAATTTVDVEGTIGGGEGSDAKAYAIDCGTAATGGSIDTVTLADTLLGVLAAPAQCSAQMLRYQPAAPFGVDGYTASGADFVSLAPDSENQGIDISATDINVGSHAVAVHAATSEGRALGTVMPTWLPSDHTAVAIGGTSGNGDVDFSVRLPTEATIPVALIMHGDAVDASGSVQVTRLVSSTADSITVTLPAAPTTVAPAHLATGVDHTQIFTVTGGNAPAYVFFFGKKSDSPDLAVVTSATTVAAQALGDHGVQLQSNMAYAWHVVALDGMTADDYASTAGSEHDVYRRDGAIVGTTAVREFQTAP